MEPETGNHAATPSGKGGERMARIAYVQAMLAQLRGIAEAEGCDVLAYLIEMANLEAGDMLRARKLPRGSGGVGRSART